MNDFALAVRKVYGDTGLKEVRKQLSPWLVQATKGDDDTVANAAPKTSNNGTSDSGADDKGGAASA